MVADVTETRNVILYQISQISKRSLSWKLEETFEPNSDPKYGAYK